MSLRSFIRDRSIVTVNIGVGVAIGIAFTVSLGFNGTDEDFCRHITTEAGVTAVPVSAFYDDPRNAPRHFARFCFCKDDSTLDRAINRLDKYFKR